MTLPKKLYKFEPFNELSLRNLKRQGIYFGSPKNFNDPYDCAITAQIKDLTPEQVERWIEHLWAENNYPSEVKNQATTHEKQGAGHKIKDVVTSFISEFRDNFVSARGITCLSEENDDLLMWAHYGGRYKGFCLEFDTNYPPFKKAKPVKYSETMPELDSMILLEDIDQVTKYLFEHLLCTKSESWKYEKEWRAFHKEAGTLFHYAQEALTGVYFGPDMEQECLEIIVLMLKG